MSSASRCSDAVVKPRRYRPPPLTLRATPPSAASSRSSSPTSSASRRSPRAATPEDVRELLDRYFDARARRHRALRRHRREVHRRRGDGRLGRADRARGRRRAGGPRRRSSSSTPCATLGARGAIQARAGVLTGEAAVTLGATDQGMVAGDLVNTAARLQSVAPPGTVLVGEATDAPPSARSRSSRSASRRSRARRRRSPAWRAIARRRRARRGTAAATASSRRSSAATTSCGCSRTCSTPPSASAGRASSRSSGQAGIGKSRLAWELEKYLDGVVEDIYWHRGRSPAYGEGISFWALGEMVRQRAGLAETDDEATTRAQARRRRREYVPDERRAALDRAAPARPARRGRDAGRVARRAVRGVADVLRAHRRRRGTVVLVFEDLQWADSGLLDFIDHLLDWSRDLPILVVTLARPELLDRRPDWGAGARNFTPLTSSRSDAAMRRAARAASCPACPADRRRRDRRPRRGHPALRGRDVRMLARRRPARARRRTAVSARGELGELAVPETLQALIAAGSTR